MPPALHDLISPAINRLHRRRRRHHRRRRPRRQHRLRHPAQPHLRRSRLLPRSHHPHQDHRALPWAHQAAYPGTRDLGPADPATAALGPADPATADLGPADPATADLGIADLGTADHEAADPATAGSATAGSAAAGSAAGWHSWYYLCRPRRHRPRRPSSGPSSTDPGRHQYRRDRPDRRHFPPSRAAERLEQLAAEHPAACPPQPSCRP